MVPAPIPVRSMPAAVRRAKYSEVRVSVMVDTLGRADMSTFKVLTSTHPWLGTSVKSAVAKWTFVPAQVAGCKVPRSWKWGVTAGKPPRA
jgi:outer membrane biosynthesis protein TonB